MPTLLINFCPRPVFVTLLTLVMALSASSANAGLQIEVRGVGEVIRTNVLAYLSLERYKNSDDLSPDFVERLQERSEREVRGALRPSLQEGRSMLTTTSGESSVLAGP